MIRGCLYSGVCPFPNEGIREIFFLRLSAIMLFPVHRHLHLLPITLATKAWQHWSTFSVSIKNKVFVFNSRWNMPAAWFSRHEAAFTRMRTVLNSLVPKMSDWAEEAWNRAQILPTSLTGDVTPDIVERGRPRTRLIFQLFTTSYKILPGRRSK